MKGQKSRLKLPEDLGIKIGTKEEKAWTDIKEGAERELAHFIRMIPINEAIIKLADEMIKKEGGK